MSALPALDNDALAGVQFRGTELVPEVGDGALIVFATDRCPWWPGSLRHTEVVLAEVGYLRPYYTVRRLRRTPRGWALTANGRPPVYVGQAGGVLVTAAAAGIYQPRRH